MFDPDTASGAATLLDRAPAVAAPIVAATDGTESSEPALVAALQMTQATHCPVYVIAIHETLPVPVFEPVAVPALLEAEAGRREAFRQKVESQVRRVAGEPHAGWTIVVRDGDPATELASLATELGAGALVIGVRHRHLADRVFGRETALRLMHDTRVPLLIVPAGFAHLPRRALFALDFSASSLEAARTALRLFGSIDHVTLMTVTPTPLAAPNVYASWREWFDDDTARGFEWARSELRMPSTIAVETVSKEGHAARAIVSVARDRSVDLIVTGTRGAGLVDRLFSGSTARGVVHAAECAVLVVRPPVAQPA